MNARRTRRPYALAVLASAAMAGSAATAPAWADGPAAVAVKPDAAAKPADAGGQPAAGAVSAAAAGARAAAAADAFLATLDAKQRAAVVFAYDDEAQRARWSNLPTKFTPRAGLRLGELSEPQRAAALALLAAALSPRGYEKTMQIVDADETLKQGERGNPLFGRDLYYLSILGTPSAAGPWMLQFGGHHLGLNLTFAGDRGTLAPSHTGAQPAAYVVGGKTVRPLGGESDKAAALLASLDEGQRKQAVLAYRVPDLVLGPGKDGKTIQPEGLKASAMTDAQRAMLLDLVGEWANLVGEPFAAARMAEVKEGLADTYFAWSGPTVPVEPGKNITAYYRVQGPKLVIEYAPQKLGGDLSMHVHTIYRDPTNDYARAPKGK